MCLRFNEGQLFSLGKNRTEDTPVSGVIITVYKETVTGNHHHWFFKRLVSDTL